MESCDLNYGQLFFMTLGFLPVLACLPCWVVAKFIYEPYIKKIELEEEVEVPYEYQFPLDDADNDGSRDYKKSAVLANTPKGIVYMRYYEKDLGFEYWADKTIDYKYLETVARKYVTIFSCKDIYISRFDLLKEKLQKIRASIEKNNIKKDEKEVEESDDVFATLKSYNQSKQKVNRKTELTRNDVVCDESNKYLNRGKLKDFNLVENPKVTETSALSFSSWKLWKGRTKDD